MTTCLVSNFQYPMRVSGLSTRWEPGVEHVKKTSVECELASLRWLGPAKALHGERWSGQGKRRRRGKAGILPVFASLGKDVPNDDEDNGDDGPSEDSVNSELFRRQMENMIGNDAKDAQFEGKDLAQLIRNKYGRSYDVQLIKKEFLGRQLLAMNVMWKYREQRSFPLTEEEYLLHLDCIAENLRGWGAVSYVRDSLQRTRERPRIGKAVSIFINPDESGERAREWINR